MSKLLDLRGLSCPEPLLRVQEALRSGDSPLDLGLDNGVSLERIREYCEGQGLPVRKSDQGLHIGD